MASILREAINEKYAGSDSRAARAVDMPVSTLHRLLHNPSATLSDGNIKKATKLIGVQLSVEEILLQPASERALGSYLAWIRASIAAIVRGGEIMAPELRRRWGERPLTRRQEIKHLRGRIEKEVPHVYNAMRRKVESGKLSHQRYLLAIHRIIQPLLDARESGYVERHADEFKKLKAKTGSSEFSRFIEHGWKRELILLNRGSDFQRGNLVLPSLIHAAFLHSADRDERTARYFKRGR